MRSRYGRRGIGVPIEGPHEERFVWIASSNRTGRARNPASRLRGPLAGRRRPGERRQSDLRRSPLPGHTPARRLPPSGTGRTGRRRFVQGLGRASDFPRGDQQQSFARSHRLWRWGATRLSPGHGRCRPRPERATNPFVAEACWPLDVRTGRGHRIKCGCSRHRAEAGQLELVLSANVAAMATRSASRSVLLFS